MTTAASAKLRAEVARLAGHRCGDCLTSELISGSPLEVEHFLPRSRGGLTVLENLWLACRQCNAHKSDRTQALDPNSQEWVGIFDPRRDRWTDHFCWSEDALRVEGKTAIGRATVEALQLNREVLVEARGTWIAAGLHPPAD